MSSDVPTFSNLSDEVSYWRQRATESAKEAKDAREELEEFQVGSRELEAELEMQLEQAEGRVKEYRSLANRLQMDNDQLRAKVEQCQREYQCQVTELQDELSEIKNIRDQLNKYVRELEQQNDDLERAKRSTIALLEDFEGRLNTAIERNAFLESELDEKESLQFAVQRLKDETRDLKAELRVLAPRHPNLSLESTSTSFEMPDNDKKVLNNNYRDSVKRRFSTADSNKLAADLETKSECEEDVKTPTRSSSICDGERAAPLTPSARLSALNIVGDLLRKVGALELKLVSCRNIVKENGSVSGSTAGGASSAGSSPNGTTKRLPRGTSTPSIKKMIDSS